MSNDTTCTDEGEQSAPASGAQPGKRVSRRGLFRVGAVTGLTAAGAYAAMLPGMRSDVNAAPAPAGSGKSSLVAQASGTTVNVITKDYSFAFDMTDIPAGMVTFNLSNQGMKPHNLTFTSLDMKSATIRPGETTQFTANLDAGMVPYICSIPTHADLGMKGNLNIVPAIPAPATDSGTVVNVIEKDFSFEFDTSMIPAGMVTFNIVNQGVAPHNLEFTTINQVSETSNAGEMTQFTVNLQPGDYPYICNIPGHEQLGMKGTLTVIPAMANPAPAATTDGTTVNVVTKDYSFTFDKTDIPAGMVTFNISNQGMRPHNLSFTSLNMTSMTIRNGEMTQFTVNLDAGMVPYICAIPGHADLGMKGNLNVLPAAPAAVPAAMTGGTMVNVVTKDYSFEFDKTNIPAGMVTFNIVNQGTKPHNLTFTSLDMKSATIRGGEMTQFTVNLDAGMVPYICSIPTHADLGMKGTLTIQ